MTAGIAVVLLTGSLASPAPEKFLASSERFGYVGTISVYNTFSDAMSRRMPRHSNIPIPQRDGALYCARAMGGEYGEFNAVLTNWYASPNRDGTNNPNNRNEGFFQMYDSSGENWQNQSAYWSQDRKTFTVEARGRNASYPSQENPGQYARLWNAGASPGSGESTKGTYLRYEYRFVATGLNGQDDGSGFILSEVNAASYSGRFWAVFQNESERHPESNGFYVVEVTFNNTSWAKTNGFAQTDKFGSKNIRR